MFVILATLASCAGGPRVRYACGDAAVTAAFSGQDQAIITVNAATYRLTRAMSGSGARYEGGAGDGYVEFWEHQGSARLTVGQHVFPACRRAS